MCAKTRCKPVDNYTETLKMADQKECGWMIQSNGQVWIDMRREERQVEDCDMDEHKTSTFYLGKP